ncbi:unnamed protein product [Dicrocoelium dendriticum]|nr:unnamed protein product [Dicrocoelium dendriticum]
MLQLTFQFCFPGSVAEEESRAPLTSSTCDAAVEVFSLQSAVTSVFQLPVVSHKVQGDHASLELLYIPGSLLEKHVLRSKETDDPDIRDSSVISAIRSGCDIVPGILEGGFTVWDGSKELITAVLFNLSHSVFRHKTVLELGCGCGLPGLAAMKLGAKRVTFQDYNRDVLTHWTIPNAKLNLAACESAVPHLDFVSGDWLRLAEHWESSRTHKYDIILTAETIYRPDLYHRLLRVIKATLDPCGSVFMMCKGSYGSGGNFMDFLDIVNAEDSFHVDVEPLVLNAMVKYFVKIRWKYTQSSILYPSI